MSYEVTTTYTNLYFAWMIGLEPIILVPKTNAVTEVTLTNTTALPEKKYKSMNLFSYIPILKNAVRKATRLIYVALN